MSRLFLPPQNLFLRSLFAAIFFHIFFFSFFVFTFPKRFTGHKPQLISLGSILDLRDVESVSNRPSGSPAGVKDLPEKGIAKFVYEFFEMAPNPSMERDVPKPAFEGNTRSVEDKMSVKPTFDQGQAQPETVDEPLVDDGIPPYRPLRFSPYD